MPKKLFSLSIGPWVLSPGVPSTITLSLILPLVVYLGFWQLQRASLKTGLETQIQTMSGTAPVNILSLKQPLKEIRFKPLELSGMFTPHSHLLLDNQIHEHQAGYRVLTPFELQPSLPLLLIDRGWISKAHIQTNNALLSTPAMAHAIELKGFVNHPPHGIALGESPVHPENFTSVIQTLNYDALEQAFGREFFPFTMQVTQPIEHIFTFIPPTVPVPATRHLGYALQWFTMAIASMLYYLFINTKRND